MYLYFQVVGVKNYVWYYDVYDANEIIRTCTGDDATFSESCLGHSTVFSQDGMRALFNTVENVQKSGVFTCAGYSVVIGKSADGNR